MSLVRITNTTAVKPASAHLHGAHLDMPSAGAESDVYSFDVSGWALGKQAPVARIEVLLEGRPMAEISGRFERRDVASAFRGIAGAEKSGFRGSIGTLKLPSNFEIVICATLATGVRVPLGRIEGRRKSLPASQEATIQPLTMNTIGRSGSTWLTWLLGRHENILAFEPFGHDARVATYWMSVLQDLSQPSSYRQQFGPRNLAAERWWLGDDESTAGEFGQGRLQTWLGAGAVESLANLCQTQIEGFYAELSAWANRSSPRYFVEKVLPYQVLPDLLSELYPEAREIVLVRDFRDLLSSVLAFNEKRGYQAFGREQRDSDADYIRSTLRRSAESLLNRWRSREQTAHLVRYEDLVLDPSGTLSQLLRYLELDHSNRAVERTIERAQNASGTEHHRTVSDPAASIGRWRRDLSEELQLVCAEALDPVLDQFGYEPTADRAAEPV
jgi:hypothetical protein